LSRSGAGAGNEDGGSNESDDQKVLDRTRNERTKQFFDDLNSVDASSAPKLVELIAELVAELSKDGIDCIFKRKKAYNFHNNNYLL
jgi:hypothetical protein